MKKKRKIAPKAPPKKRAKRDRTAKEGTYLGLPYESFCELSLLFFAEELMKAGYVEKVERCPSYLLCDPIHNTYAEQLKRGSKQVTQTVCLGVSYTPDFDIYFNSKALGKFIWELGSGKKWTKNLLIAQKVDGLYRVCCEVKPDFSRNSTTPKSVQSMRWLMQKHGIYTNLFRPNRIFEGLFIPTKYLLTERGTPRLIKFEKKTLSEYLKKL